MTRCLHLAKAGLGRVNPNPLVGAVVVHPHFGIIGEGFHRYFGGAHAEVNAIESVKDKTLLTDATLYVNLEPCCHQGKTPACTNLILKYKIPRVVIGQTDPNRMVAGKGIEVLQAAGVTLHLNVLENECRQLNRHFNTFHVTQLPEVTLKWVESADGFIAPPSAEVEYSQKKKLSHSITDRLVHKLRAENMAILVGGRTAVLDNPQLNLRYWPGRHPLRVVLARRLPLPEQSYLMTDGIQTLVLHHHEVCVTSQNEATSYAAIDFSQNVAMQVCSLLAAKNINSLLVEGGLNTLNMFLASGLVHEVFRIITPHNLGEGIPAPLAQFAQATASASGPDRLFHYRLK